MKLWKELRKGNWYFWGTCRVLELVQADAFLITPELHIIIPIFHRRKLSHMSPSPRHTASTLQVQNWCIGVSSSLPNCPAVPWDCMWETLSFQLLWWDLGCWLAWWSCFSLPLHCESVWCGPRLPSATGRGSQDCGNERLPGAPGKWMNSPSSCLVPYGIIHHDLTTWNPG